jgi:potassium efflux system protein
LAQEAKQMASQAATMQIAVEGGDELGLKLGDEARSLAKEFESVIAAVNEATRKRGMVTAHVDALVSRYDLIKEQLKMSGGGVAMAQVLFSLERGLPSRHALKVDLESHKAELDGAYLSLIHITESLGEQAGLEQLVATHDSGGVGQIVSAREEALEKLRGQYGRLIRELAGLVGEERRYVDEISEVRGFLSEELFWMRSSPPLGLDTLAEVPAGLKWLTSGRHWAEFGEAHVLAFRQRPGGSSALGLIFILILLKRRAIFIMIKETGVATRRIETDRFGLTLNALFWSVILALPVPLLLGWTAWALGQYPEPSSWLQGLAKGMRILTWMAFVLSFVAAICHRKGVGVGHFRWPQKPLMQIRRAVIWFVLIYVPSAVLVSSCLYGDASRYFNSAGRVAFMLGLGWTAVIYSIFLREPARDDSGEGTESASKGGTPKVGTLWGRCYFVLALVCPCFLIVLSWLGFLFTALELQQILIATMAVAVAGILVYWVLLRWFMIRVRRLALAEFLELRRVRREAALLEKEGEPEDASYGEAEAEKLNVAAIGEQTRHLLRLVCSTGSLIAVGLLWSQIFPVFVIMDSVRVVGELTLFGLAKVALIIVITTVATRNVQGFIRLVLARATKMTPGTRTAFTTLCQYGLVAIGFAWVFNLLGLGWARFGWIATALSVGLGFGLQEVVANFVCGLVLLFERPIRVGDFVTVEGMTGKVTKIRMRATTIVNWDHQEFVVPNKNFITGTLLNWTLQDGTTRIVVTVGVAYGSDTDRAQEILLEVARAHPQVLDDPQPVATFEEFADSSLTLRLKAHIPHVDKRIQSLSELHSAIKKRFEEEGVEIAFPQRDLHLRTAGDWVLRAGAAGPVDGEESA